MKQYINNYGITTKKNLLPYKYQVVFDLTKISIRINYVKNYEISNGEIFMKPMGYENMLQEIFLSRPKQVN